MEFNGLANFINLLYDKNYHQSLYHTVIFTASGVVFSYIVALGIAILLNERIKFRGLFRALVLLPWVVPSVVAGAIWWTMYSPTHGIINYYLIKLGLLDSPFAWLGNTKTALGAVTVVAIWKYLPWYIVSLLAGLQSIPEDLYEAAKIDGANKLQRFRYVTFPMLLPVSVIVLALGTIWRWNHFDTVWFMTGGGPAFSSHIILTYNYLVSFQFFKAGYGAAIAVSSVIFLTILIVFLTRQVRREL